MKNQFECGVTEYVLIGKGYLWGIGGVDTTIYCTNVPVYVNVDEIQALTRLAMDRGNFEFRVSNIITEPVMVDDIDVEQSIFDLRHTVDKDTVDFTLRFTGVTEFTFTEGYQEPQITTGNN